MQTIHHIYTHTYYVYITRQHKVCTIQLPTAIHTMVMCTKADDSTGCMNTSWLHMLVQIPLFVWESKIIGQVLHNTNKSSCTPCLYSLPQEQSTGRCWQCFQPTQYVLTPTPAHVNHKLHTPKPLPPIHVDLLTHTPTPTSCTHICMHPHPTGPTYTQYLPTYASRPIPSSPN